MTEPRPDPLFDLHAAADPPSIAALFDAEPDRLARLGIDVAGIRFDFSKLAASAATIAALHDLAAAADLPGWRARLFAGEAVNPSEGRAATHMAERGTGSVADNASAAVGQAAMAAIVDQLRGDDVSDILHIGIGGSALGPALLLDALGREW